MCRGAAQSCVKALRKALVQPDEAAQAQVGRTQDSVHIQHARLLVQLVLGQQPYLRLRTMDSRPGHRPCEERPHTLTLLPFGIWGTSTRSQPPQ